MRKFLFHLFLGTDELVAHMYAMFSLRKSAMRRHSDNKELALEIAMIEEKLHDSQTELEILKAEYDENRLMLEKAYRLELT